MLENKYARRQEIFEGLRKLAKELNICIMTATQKRSFNGDYNAPINYGPFRKERGLDLIIIDYMDLIKEPDEKI